MPQIPSLLEMLQAGVHFGHQESRWHPKMKPYIFGARNGIHIVDLEKTQVKLQEALDFIRDTVGRGGNVLFLGTKRQAQPIVSKYAQECGTPYVTGRWLGGTLTNFHEVLNLVKHYKDLKTKQASGELAKYTKKEQSGFAKEIADLDSKVGGIQNLERAPDALFVIDIKKEKTAIDEALSKKIPVVALMDTNCNPDRVTHPIPSNDDAVKSIELMTRLAAEAVKEGKALREKGLAEAKASREAALAAQAAKAPVGK